MAWAPTSGPGPGSAGASSILGSGGGGVGELLGVGTAYYLVPSFVPDANKYLLSDLISKGKMPSVTKQRRHL